jgi:hypothetical protein
MTDDHKQRTYAAKRAAVTGRTDVPLVEFRVYFADGREIIERVIGWSMVAAYHPDAIRIERVDACGGFY